MLNVEKGAPIIDVREPEEYAEGHLPGAALLPLGEMTEETLSSFGKERKVYVYCRSGRRSEQAKSLLESLGYREVVNLGGVLSWPEELVK